MIVLVTGAAGFIGMHVCKALLLRGDSVIGVDNLNDYYDPKLKLARLGELKPFEAFAFLKGDVSDDQFIEKAFADHKPQKVVHLAAQAGVRYSIENPKVYIKSNVVGFANILECCRHANVEHLVYASSSSVYGANTKMPFDESDRVDHPVSLYAATKKSNELMAHTYSHLFGLPTTGLRYFTVYGPWGRPDMSPWLFTSAILEGRKINIYNEGKMQRDFTYVDDIVAGTVAALDVNAEPNVDFDTSSPEPSTSYAPYRVCNIGNNEPSALMDFIGEIEGSLGVEAKKAFLPMQAGDVVATYANIDVLQGLTGYRPKTALREGVASWVDWYKGYIG